MVTTGQWHSCGFRDLAFGAWWPRPLLVCFSGLKHFVPSPIPVGAGWMVWPLFSASPSKADSVVLTRHGIHKRPPSWKADCEKEAWTSSKGLWLSGSQTSLCKKFPRLLGSHASILNQQVSESWEAALDEHGSRCWCESSETTPDPSAEAASSQLSTMILVVIKGSWYHFNFNSLFL